MSPYFLIERKNISNIKLKMIYYCVCECGVGVCARARALVFCIPGIEFTLPGMANLCPPAFKMIGLSVVVPACNLSTWELKN